mgnify:CR=1 FL=1
MSGLNTELHALDIEPTTGALSVGLKTTTVFMANAIAVDGQARFLIVNGGSEEIAIHGLDADKHPLPATAYPVDGTNWNVALDPSGTTAYVPSPGTNTIFPFHIDAAALTMAPLPSASLASPPYTALAHPTSPLLYTANTDGSLGVFSIAAGGERTALTTDAMVATSGYPLTIDSAATHLYVGGSPPVWIIDVDGAVLTLNGSVEQPQDNPPIPRAFAWVHP